jgi:hypothetical protein
MKDDFNRPHPATHWEQEARRFTQEPLTQVRLAAMAGHMRLDKITARRAALIDLLADGRPHLREEIWQIIEGQLGDACWGKRPQEALMRDLKALRRGRLRIAYSRRPGATGYYLQYPPIEPLLRRQYGATNRTHLEHLRQLSVPQKNQMAFAAADFALRQKRLLLKEEQPQWSAEQIEREARRLVFDVPLLAPTDDNTLL